MPPVDPHGEITVTSGCTEAIAAALLGLLEPGDEVVLLEPYYDSYRACVAMAGAVPRFVRLRPPWFRLEPDALERAVTPRTRAILVNSPHNPTGHVFSRDELENIARVCVAHDLIAISDEVYERLVYDGTHTHIASLPGMGERTVTLSSLGKTFSLTGWKIGWAIAPPALTAAVRAAHQFLTFATATPLQHAAVAALDAPASYYEELLRDYRQRRDLLVDGLRAAGLKTIAPEGSYFAIADCTSVGFDDDVAFCRHLIERVGVAAIPVSAFIRDPDRDGGRHLVRFAFCKRDETLRAGIDRLARLRAATPAR
jgi:aspartate/methionine/tyrosine aminotransferase